MRVVALSLVLVLVACSPEPVPTAVAEESRPITRCEWLLGETDRWLRNASNATFAEPMQSSALTALAFSQQATKEGCQP